MEKVIVINSTGSSSQIGKIHASGVIEFESGEFSHILHEKQFNKVIKKYEEPKVEEVKPEVIEPSSDKPKKKATSKKG